MAADILIVDDDLDFLNVLRTALEARGHRVRAAESARAARELVQARRPDLVVADLMMEEPDAGFSLCHYIKRQDPTIPVLLVTGVTAETGLRFDAGTGEERAWIQADGVLDKPVRLEQLEAELRRLLPGGI